MKFGSSTHHTHWLIPNVDVRAQRRCHAHEMQVNAIKVRRLSSEIHCCSLGIVYKCEGAMYSFDHTTICKSHCNHFIIQEAHSAHGHLSAESLVFLSENDAHELVQYYLSQIITVCETLALSDEVLGTACMYFRRYYLDHSVLERHPRSMMFLCLFLACKTTDTRISLSDLLRGRAHRQEDEEFVILNELHLLESLNFHLYVHNTFRPLRGFVLDMSTRFKEILTVPSNTSTVSSTPLTADDLCQSAIAMLKLWLLSDVYLMYPPSQIALAALYCATQHHNLDISNFIDSLTQTTPDTTATSTTTRDNTSQVMHNPQTPTSEQLTQHITRIVALAHTCSRPSDERAQVSDSNKLACLCC
jgi:cyclin ccl1